MTDRTERLKKQKRFRMRRQFCLEIKLARARTMRTRPAD
jgi:hypothetical protein